MCEFNSQGIDYIYNHGRLTDITAPHSGSVHYDYDAVGRIAKRWDASGTEEFTYDALGNVIGSTRRMAVPTESNVYVFHTGYKYDSYGRMQQITYPDGEQVDYHYGIGGQLADMVSSLYDTICIRQYDERGQRVYQKYGNGTETFYQYSSDRNWLTDLTISNSVGTFSEKHYAFDAVGNVSSLSVVEGLSGSIASWNATYTYDNRNRLVSGSGPYSYTVTHSPTGKLFRKSFDNLPSISVSTPAGLIYGYDKDSLTHQPRVLYDTVSQSALELFWDADGNLAEMLDCDRDWVRMHRWNDFDRLTLSLGHDFCGYYGYDAEGIRTYKLTGTCKMDDVNGGDIGAQAIFDDMVLYPSPFVVVTPRGYTNHYYAGSERIASRIGNLCWLHDPFVSYEKPSPEWTALEEFQNLPDENYPFGRTNDWSDIQKNTTPVTDYLSEVQYLCDAMGLKILDVMYKGDLLYDIMDCKFSSINPVPVYYYHPDHLGSTSWVTDGNGDEIEFLAYMPYGEPLLDAHLNNYHYRYGQNSARYKFTGKERDAETGYDYIEQRYYWKDGGFWLRPDPLMDKYINLSSYAYCNGNPLKYVDPDGKEKHNMMDPHTDDIEQCYLFEGAYQFPDNGDKCIYFFSHGSQTEMYPYGREQPMLADDFKTYISENSDVWKNTEDKSTLTIVLISCETGKGENPIAQQISKLLPDATIVAPTEDVKAFSQGEITTIGGSAKQGVQTVKDIGNPKYSGQWRYFRNGELIGTSTDGYMYHIQKKPIVVEGDGGT